TADDLPPLLLGLAVPHDDVDDLVRLLPTRERSPGLWWLLERCTLALVGGMGALDGGPPFPVLPERHGVPRYFYVYAFLATLPHVRAFHRAREIPDDVSWLTLADLGRNMAAHRSREGVGGLDFPSWHARHFRGAIYALGRLQFERGKLGRRTGRAIAAAGLPHGPGDPVLALHVPAYYGPLTPSACDASFARAKAFFARHFPEERYDLAVCHSWLLDEQLGEYLAEDANIIRFQRRFRLAYRPDADDASIVRSVFNRLAAAPDELPRRTTLERAVVDHLRAGRHWHGGAGWLRL
ncbi:MAG TPA: acyltransferase domain-containing protein, partial [Chloroflexota bacterium]